MELFFKLFNSIKSEHEATEFARLELSALVGPINAVGNVIEVVASPKFRPFLENSFSTDPKPLRFVDALTNELPYGPIQGYLASVDDQTNLEKLVKRLAYTREVYATFDLESEALQDRLGRLFPSGTRRGLLTATKGKRILLRATTDQFFLEKSDYVSRLSRDEAEIRRNAEILLSYPNDQIYRIPASATLRVGRRLEDWFAIREEASLYLTHYMYPYKGKFHPKMARALINYVCPEDSGTVLDNFAGSGTSIVEALSLGLKGVGVEINPLSALMVQAKCDCLEGLDLERVRVQYQGLRRRIEERLRAYSTWRAGQSSLDSDLDFESLQLELETAKQELAKYVPDGDDTLTAVILARMELAPRLSTAEGRFLMMVVGGTVSDVTRRTNAAFLPAMDERFGDLYLRVLLASLLRDQLRLRRGAGISYVGDNRDLSKLTRVDGHPSGITDDSVQGIVNSPPYSTALDYIENDFPQLVLLKLGESPKVLESEMIGLPKTKSAEAVHLIDEIEAEHSSALLSGFPRENIARLIQAGRRDAALRSAKFFLDMKRTLSEMFRVLGPGRKAAIVIGNNSYKAIDGSQVECENDRALLALGEEIGFEKDYVLTERDLEKSSTGAIRSESIVCLRKPTAVPG